MFVLESEVTIGGFRFSGVNEVRISRSLHSIVETATIKIPSIARIVKAGKVVAGSIITGKQFSEGDPVKIRLGYNGDLQTEFTGFVRRSNLGMPLEVECEGYSWLLRRNTITDFWKTINVKDFLSAAVGGIDAKYTIDIQCEMDIVLNNVAANTITGIEMISDLAKYTDGALVCFFKAPGVLWCGMAYTKYANGVDTLGVGQNRALGYKLGYNALKDNGLKERLLINDPVEVRYSKRMATGEVISQSSDIKINATGVHNRVLNHIGDAVALKTLANEKANRLNYAGYEGYVNGFLQPYINAGDSVYITDSRYEERDGVYMVEGTEVVFGVGGARRVVDVGMKLGG